MEIIKNNIETKNTSINTSIDQMKLIREEVIRRWDLLGLLDKKEIETYKDEDIEWI
jgi:hypothetical protein